MAASLVKKSFHESQEKRKGQDKLAVRGIVKSTVVSGLKATAQNIKRFAKYMCGGYKDKSAKTLISGIPVLIYNG